MQFEGSAPKDDEVAAIAAVLALAAQSVASAPRISAWRLAMRYTELELDELRLV